MIERMSQVLYDTQTHAIDLQNKAEFLAGKIVFEGIKLNEITVDVVGGMMLGAAGGILYFNYKKEKVVKESNRDLHENVNYGCARGLWAGVGALCGALTGCGYYVFTH